MKKYLILGILAAFFAAPALNAQEQADSSVQARHPIFTTMPGFISISQPSAVEQKFEEYFKVDETTGQANIHRFSGDEALGEGSPQFGIRIYSDSAQNARSASSQALARFQNAFPEISVVRTFSSPYFKVTAGKYATRQEAQKALNEIRSVFPSAYIVRGN